MNYPVKDAIPIFLEQAKVNFQLNGELVPVIAMNIDGEPQTDILSWQTEKDKDAIVDMLIEKILARNLIEYLITATAEFENQEYVLVLYANTTEEMTYFAQVHRYNDVALLGEYKTTDAIMSRFTNLFARAVALHN